MAVMVLWITSTRFLDIASGTQYQSFSQQGKYPMVTANPSVVQYIRNNANKWLDKALIQLPGRFGQRLCSLLAQLGEMANSFELCKQATLKSLEYSEGKITEITPAEIPISLAAFYESKGDMDNAFRYYTMALEGLRSAVPSIYADIVIYRTALMNSQRGNIKEAMQIIGRYHPAFHGIEYPVNWPARELTLQLAKQLAPQLGFATPQDAVKFVLE
jgi:tetratricopeptide (TPR) repeat protein